MSRSLSPIDHLLIGLDRARRAATGEAPPARRPSPSRDVTESAPLDDAERRHAAGLMRINHTGEVCAQALYQGQALTARESAVRSEMQRAAEEELDHLAWCEARVSELGERTSVLNPLFYAASFTLGAIAGAIGDRVSLGFVAATEEQVGKHLQAHLDSLPEQDTRSRRIVEKMLEDETRHRDTALAAGGAEFPRPVKETMTVLSKLMTESTYRV
jgi:ubiquinone biosynthesis monooxygenase Coq7